MKKRKPKHGGARPGAGRPKGAKSAHPAGRTVKTGSIAMPQEDWTRLDVLKGEGSRGWWISGKVR